MVKEVKVCHAEDMKQGDRRTEVIHGRHVVIVHSPKELGKFHCIDAICYHMGGPLYNGDIEDVFDNLVIQCPWHKHVISLEDGSMLDKDLNSQTTCEPKKQRVHRTALDNEGFLWVKLTQPQFGLPETMCESDRHYMNNNNVSPPKRKGQRNDGPAARRRMRLAKMAQKNKLTNYFGNNCDTMI